MRGFLSRSFIREKLVIPAAQAIVNCFNEIFMFFFRKALIVFQFTDITIDVRRGFSQMCKFFILLFDADINVLKIQIQVQSIIDELQRFFV